MKRMLSPDILQDEKVLYNDDIEYVEGDDIYNPTKDLSPETYTNPIEYTGFIVDKLAKTEYYAPELEYEDIPLNVDHMKDISSQVSHIYVNFDNEVLKDFENILIDKNDPNTQEYVDILKDMDYDGIAYYAHTDTLTVPQSIYSYITKGNTLNAKVSVYNINKAFKTHHIFDNVKTVEVPELEFKYIPNTIKYTKIKNPTGTHVFAPMEYKFSDRTVAYVNLPKSIYDKCLIDCRSLSYDIEKGCYYGHVFVWYPISKGTTYKIGSPSSLSTTEVTWFPAL